MQKVWFITGANRGLGRAFTEAALNRGDRVAAASRKSEDLVELAERFEKTLLPLTFDTTDRSAVESAVQKVAHHFGRIDVLVNNAGFGTFGAVEELTEEQLMHQFDVNLFGTFRVTKAILPIMRKQKAGRILQISSVSGLVTFPLQGAYAASKWAVEALLETLAEESKGFGIKVTLVEPGPFKTGLHGGSSANTKPLPEYDDLRKSMEGMQTVIEQVAGDPEIAGKAVLEIVDAAEPPLRILLGKSGPAYVPSVYTARMETWRQWEHLSNRDGLGEAFPSR